MVAGTVLIVEDEPGLLKLFNRLLEGQGYRTLSAEDADEALRIAESTGEIDILVSDIVLPGRMNGLALCDRIRKSRPHLPCIFVSGYNAPEHGNIPDNAVLLRKPFKRATLIEAIADLQAARAA